MKTVIRAAIILALTVAPAMAFQCPADIAKINQALQTTSLSDAEKAQVIALRDQGQALHDAGQHQQSVDTLAQAKQMLGIE
ncbi:hypothetical protein EDC22_1113 [Tepidamorphus gemmatus]|jgi:hypothetical protein|uniref:Uncharacterized protein n=1 Tax=Tepidamorphus gemmatus TaxID=747076 RepID=A0A4R3M052_9HYPH|nr:hypothetical protein [Tepidamorphus gemmatus]TCT06421.1 hypothetical protein EDC22_1113 [Tepidamorphus gemmatus]